MIVHCVYGFTWEHERHGGFEMYPHRFFTTKIKALEYLASRAGEIGADISEGETSCSTQWEAYFYIDGDVEEDWCRLLLEKHDVQLNEESN